MKIGNVIKDIRTEMKISQGELAKDCNITQSYLSQIENNTKMASHNLLVSICEKLNIPLPALYYLAIEETDVPQSKLAAFKHLSPTIKSLVKSVFC